MNFKIGQKVVCVMPDKKYSWLIKDKIYPVINCFYCSSCGIQSIDIGYGKPPFPYIGTQCHRCNTPICDGIRTFASHKFRLIEYNSAHDEIIEKFPLTEEVPDTPIKEPQI